jgi:asparagine synthase (glutamine-hydrolysing)
MTLALAHRGPDGEGFECLPLGNGARAVFGHRRLAVLDASPAGAQPMRDPATGNVISLNGDVYNFRSLRAMLEARGHRFRSGTDTEVVLHAYAEWGGACLARLHGIFAFALFDATRQTLLLARDRLGVKPLYFWQRGDELLVASEVRALLASGLVKRELDDAGLASFLALGAAQEPSTMIRDVRALPPGHSATWADGRLTLRRYWAPGPAAEVGSRREAASRLRVLLAESVERQLVSDVPVGAFLSGGLDSTTVVALMRRAGAPAHSVSVVFPQPEYCESAYARHAARALTAPHHEVCVDGDAARSLVPAALAAMDQPTIDGVNTYIAAGAARGLGLKVALSGLGGDELFGGHPSFARVPWLERLIAMPHPVRRAVAAAARPWAARHDGTRKLAALLGDAAAPHAAYRAVRQLFTASERGLLVPGTPLPPPDFADQVALQDDFARISWLELRHYTLNMLLRDTDVMGMAHGVDVRVPLLDEKVVEMALAIPARFKTRGRGVKPLLAAAMRNEVPSAIVSRRKQGFGLPIDAWLAGPLGAEVSRTLQSPLLDGVVDRQGRRRVWDAYACGRTSWHRPWALYVLARWVERHVERTGLSAGSWRVPAVDARREPESERTSAAPAGAGEGTCAGDPAPEVWRTA